MTYVRFERPPEISVARRGDPSAPSTCFAKYVRSESRSTPSGDSSAMGEESIGGCESSGWARDVLHVARCDGFAGAARVAGDAPDGHVDAIAGCGAFLFGLPAPEAVLAVLASPAAALA